MAAPNKPSLDTLGEIFRFAASRFRAARLAYGHGTTNARDEAAFLVLEGLGLPIDRLDLCTGSGCLAILAALTFPRARIDAADLSAGALALARRNVAAHRLGDRITLHRGDLFAPLHGRRYDLILSNPPYVDAQA